MNKDGHNLWLCCPQCIEYELIVHLKPRHGHIVECDVCHLIMRLVVIMDRIGLSSMTRGSLN